MQENNSQKKSSPQTRLISGLLAVATFAVAFTASIQLLSGSADAFVQPAVAKNDGSGAATTPGATANAPETTPFAANAVFSVNLGPYEPVVPLSPTPTSTTTTDNTAAGAASSTTGAASSEADSSAAAAATQKIGFDPNTVGGTGFGNIASYKAANSDVVGWIRIPNTNINHPVLYHKDTNYYMALDINKNYSRNGVIWADQECQYGAGKYTRNTVIYGHNWTNISSNPRIGNANDVMFGQLAAFHHLSFAQQTPYIHYSTEQGEATWVVFAAFYTDVNFNYIACYPDDTLFANIVNGAKARSQHIYDVEVAYSDKLLTLSTCTRAWGSSDRQRFVVMARQLRAGETTQTAINVTANPAPLRPIL